MRTYKNVHAYMEHESVCKIYSHTPNFSQINSSTQYKLVIKNSLSIVLNCLLLLDKH